MKYISCAVLLFSLLGSFGANALPLKAPSQPIKLDAGAIKGEVVRDFRKKTSAPMALGTQKLTEAKKEAILREKAKEYESVFLSKMLDQAVPKGENSMLFGGGHGSDVFRSMLIDEYASTMAAAGGIGLSDKLTKEMMQLSRR